MNHCQNLISLLRRGGFESVPVEFMLCPSLEEEFKAKFSSDTSYEEYFNMPWRRALGITYAQNDSTLFYPYHKQSDINDPNFSIDEMGVGHRKTSTSMHMSQMLHPLGSADSTEQIDEYPLPPIDISKSLESTTAQVHLLHEKGLAAVGNMQCTIWESAWYIRGMENLMMDMMSEDPMADCILDKIAAWSLSRAETYARAGVDILFLGDDIGMQSSIMMSHELYNAYLKPRLQKIIAAAKKINPNIIVFYHSCGYVEPFIETLIEVGVDVLNPVQPECMNFSDIYEKYGDRLSFHGTIGTQTTMPFGTPADVRHEVEKNLKIAGAKGGLFVAPTHLLEPEVPFDNILAYIDVCKNFCG